VPVVSDFDRLLELTAHPLRPHDITPTAPPLVGAALVVRVVVRF
jgi:hypothetical protein